MTHDLGEEMQEQRQNEDRQLIAIRCVLFQLLTRPRPGVVTYFLTRKYVTTPG